jgi:two-component system cell cycle sensor histidine kinase/response regulator CckA
MSATLTPRPAWPRAMARIVSRDRLQTFRRLFLLFALFALLGAGITLGVMPATSLVQRALIAGYTITLAAWWVFGYRRGAFALLALPIEGLLLVGLTHGMRDPLFGAGVYFIGIQFRALYGSRRDAFVLGAVYTTAFVVTVVLSPSGPAVFTPGVLLRAIALGFSTYLMHTLAEVLSRDLERTTALRRSEDRYRVLFEQNPFPMWAADPESLRLLDANQAAVEQYGYTREEFLSMTVGDLRSKDEIPSLERIRSDIGSDRRLSHLTRHKKRDGSVIDVEVTADTVEFEGKPTRIALAVDVTHRKRAEDALRESEQRFRSVAENLREALMITDTHDRIILANSRVREVLGYEPDEVAGKNATDLLLPPARRNVFRDRLRRRLNGEVELYEAEMVRKDGTRIYTEVSASPYRDASGRIIGTLGAISDITERKRLEDRLRQAMRMEAVGQLAGGVAHDFNNLLTVIKCHTELMRGEMRPNDPAREGVAEIERAATRGATLTQQLLAFSRKQLLQPRRVVLGEVLASIMPVLRRIIASSVELDLHTDASTGEVLADPLQLEYVLVTMARNSNDAMPHGGRITIEARVLELSDTDPSMNTLEMPSGRYAVVSFDDTGAGMEPAVMERVFEPFFTTKAPGEGSGLGLASVYGIVRQSGGFVDVESTPNVGTTFRIYLPLATAHTPTVPSSPALQPA